MSPSALPGWSLPITNPVLTFAVLMWIILIAPMLAQRLRAPGILGLIVAGVLVGPHALGLLERGETVVLLGTVGLLYIMFVAGLEVNLVQFRRYRGHSLLFGAISFLVPQLLGTWMARSFLGFDWAAAVLLGSMFGSHTLLTFPLANRLGLARNRAVTTGIGGTLVTDTSALLVLAVVAHSTRGALDLAFWALLLGSLAVYTAAVWWGLPRFGRWFFRTVPAEGSVHFVFIIAAVFLCAYLAQVAGVEPILGSFLAGLALNRLVPRQSALKNRLEFAGSWLFIPIFLLSVGMLVDPRVLVSGAATWKVMLAMVVTVTATKYLAATLAARLLGYDRLEGSLLFGLSVNQAAATLAAVMVGFQLGIFDEAVLNGAILMIFVTCLIGPWVTQSRGRALALRSDEEGEDRALAPRRILIPLKNPEAVDAILDVALMVREADAHEPLYPLTVVQEADADSSRMAAAERLLGVAVMHAAAADAPVAPTTRLDANAAEGILRAIRELRISTVVMGWTDPAGTRGRIFGSVLDQLLSQAPQQFLVCRLTMPLSAARRLVALLPPFAQREPGFPEAAAAIKTLAQRAGLELVLSAAEGELEAIARRFEAVFPKVPFESLPVASFEAWLEPWAMDTREGDLLVLLAARNQQISWRPSLDILPKRLAQVPQLAGLIAVYPAEETHEPQLALARGPAAALPLGQLFAPERLALGMAARDPRELVQTLVAPLGDLPISARQALARDLERVAREAALEIDRGTVLLHAHSPRVQRPLGFLATLPQGLAFPGVARPADVVFVLLAPQGMPAAAHLEHLSGIARLLHDGANLERIRSARAPQDLAPLWAVPRTAPPSEA